VRRNDYESLTPSLRLGKKEIWKRQMKGGERARGGDIAQARIARPSEGSVRVWAKNRVSGGCRPVQA